MTRKLPQPTRADLSAWRNLIRETRRSVADPTLPAGDLGKAERAAKRAVVLGTLDRENPCVQLVRAVRQYVDATVRQRRDQVGALRELADLVEAKLPGREARNPQPAPAEPRPPRADIYG